MSFPFAASGNLTIDSGGDGSLTGVASVNRRTQLVRAAQEFEASMMQELLKPMQGDAAEDAGDSATGAEAGKDTLMSYGTEALAGAMARSGGLGIARRVVEQVERQEKKGLGVRGLRDSEAGGELRFFAALRMTNKVLKFAA